MVTTVGNTELYNRITVGKGRYQPQADFVLRLANKEQAPWVCVCVCVGLQRHTGHGVCHLIGMDHNTFRDLFNFIPPFVIYHCGLWAKFLRYIFSLNSPSSLTRDCYHASSVAIK